MAADDDYHPSGKKTLSQKCSDFSRSIWDGDKKEFIGRTGSSWAKIGLFYLIFYSCLAGFFAVMLVGFFATLSDDAPTQQGMYSLIKGNPGMGFRPMPSVESTLIRFDSAKPDTYSKLVDNIDKTLEVYRQNQSELITCPPTYRQGKCEKDKECEICSFNLAQQLGTNCTKENKYGYSDGKPCILLKINKVYGWQPQPFGNESQDDTFAQDARKALGSRMDPNYIGISCDGENEGDADNVFQTTYYPNLGFSYAYFPYFNNKGYLPPLVFVQIEARKGVLIQVWCKLWVKNIKHHKNDKAGSSHFELLID